MFFEGYLKILGIEASAYINFTMQAMEMYVYGRVWNLIYAELYVSASYDYTSIKDAHFYIRVIVDLRGLTDVSSLDPFWKNDKFQFLKTFQERFHGIFHCLWRYRIKRCRSLFRTMTNIYLQGIRSFHKIFWKNWHSLWHS